MTSRNFSLGAELGQGRSLADIMASRNTVAEGVPTAKAAADIARKLNIDMPICAGVDQVLHHNGRVSDVVQGLLSRDIKSENA